MFRKSALAMAMLGAFASTNVVALGLGEIELKSALNQPLNAEVELLSASAPELDELKVSVASAQAFADAGIDRPLFLNKLSFNVGHNAEGKPVVHITSRDVVREPFLDFLLEMSWSKGRLVREYTVLVDPPVTMPAPAPVTRAPVQTASPVVAAPPATRVTHTAQMPPVSVSPGEYGPTRRHDTLWSIAESVRPDTGVSVEQTMLGLLHANPEAFIDDNINNLKAGYVLRVPDREALTAISRAEALRESRAQYAAWRAAHEASPATAVAAADSSATESSVTPAVPAAAGGGEPSLQLIAPDASTEAGGATGAGGLDEVHQELMMANEALEEQRRQNEETSGRLSVLEEQIANMQRLIQLKDNELARLQAQAAGEMVPEQTPEQTPEQAAAEELQPAGTPVQATESDADTPAASGDAEPATAGMEQAGAESPVSTPAPATAGMEQAGAESPESTPAEEALAGTDMDAPDDLDASPEESAAADAMPDAGESLPAADGTMPAAPEPVAEAPSAAETRMAPDLVDRLLANPLWLGAGAAVVLLLGLFGMRRKRSVETEFQESILQAAHAESHATDSEMVASEPTSKETKSAHSSLLSEFAVSDMGSIRNDGEADPLAEADVYLAYGRYQQAEDLIKDALEKDKEREDLQLKLLEVFMAARNTAAFDEQAQTLLGRLESSSHPTWEKIAEMGRELSPDNPMYRDGGTPPAAGGEADSYPEPDHEGLDFDIDLSYSGDSDDNRTDSVEFEPSPAADERLDPDAFDMDSVEPDAVAQNGEALEFDLEDFDIETAESAEEEVQGDGELTDLDEISTKLDLARAYIDMGDPDGAKSILDEVMEEGSDNQKEEARGIMAQIS